MRKFSALAYVTVLFVVSCSGGGQKSNEAVREAIESHLKEQPKVMLNNMKLEMGDVKFSGKNATADVMFRSKQMPDLAVGVRYTLRWNGSRWQVVGSAPTSGMGGNPHGTSEANPHAGMGTEEGSGAANQPASPQPSH